VQNYFLPTGLPLSPLIKHDIIELILSKMSGEQNNQHCK